MNKQEKTIHTPQSNDQKNKDNADKKQESFDKGHNQSGYAEKEPRKKPEQGGNQPKVSNEDNDITNTDQQDRIDEVEEGTGTEGNLSDNNDPEIDTPIYDPEKTEKKIPSIKQ